MKDEVRKESGVIYFRWLEELGGWGYCLLKWKRLGNEQVRRWVCSQIFNFGYVGFAIDAC